MKSTGLSLREKLSYGIGATGKDMVCGLIFTYAMIYFTDVLQLSASFVGSLFFLAKFWDAVNDLGMGMTYTIMDIPYWSMLPNLSQDKREREKVSVIPRIFASVGGSLLVGGLGLQIMDFRLSD